MKRLFCIFLFAGLILPLTAQNFGDDRVDRLYSEILDADFYSDKIEAGQRLGRLGTPQAREALLSLLEEDSYWDREAAVSGLIYFDERSVSLVLLDLYLNDFMVETLLEELFLQHWDRFSPLLKENYYDSDSSVQREQVLRLIGMAGGSDSLNFLKTIVYDISSSDRVLAFEMIIANSGAGQDRFIRGFLNDEELRQLVLDYILANGDSSDLQLFIVILDSGEDEFYPLAFNAVKQWGTANQQEEIYFGFLTSGEPETVYTAMSVFDQIRSMRIMKQLIVLSREGEYQSLRMMAGLRLTGYNNPEIVSPLIELLDEQYIAARADGWDIFLAHITLGISALFNHFSERQRREDFFRIREIILVKLQTLTGQLFTEYSEWAEWAAFNGYTINGISLMQKLFSTDDSVREKAVNSALRLLETDEKSFLADNPQINPDNQFEMEAVLARYLLERNLIYP